MCGNVAQVGVRAAIFVDDVSKLLAVGREISGLRFPFRIGGPGDLFGGDIEERDVWIATSFVGGDEQNAAVRRDRTDAAATLALMLGEIFGCAGGNVNAINIRVVEACV